MYLVFGLVVSTASLNNEKTVKGGHNFTCIINVAFIFVVEC